MAEEKKSEATTNRVQPVGMSDTDFKAKCALLDEFDRASPENKRKKFGVDPATKQLVKL